MRFRYNIWTKAISLAMVCLFLVNDFAWADPFSPKSATRATLAPPSGMNDPALMEKAAALNFLLAAEGVIDDINEQVAREKEEVFKKKGEWKIFRTEFVEDVYDSPYMGRCADRNNIIEGVKSAVIIRVSGLLAATGQSAYFDLTCEIEASKEFNGLPVMYIDSTLCDTSDKCVQKHEIDELLQWENLRLNILHIDTRSDMAAWIEEHFDSPDRRLAGTDYKEMKARRIAKLFCGRSYPVKLKLDRKTGSSDFDFEYMRGLFQRYGTAAISDRLNIAAKPEGGTPAEGAGSIVNPQAVQGSEKMRTVADGPPPATTADKLKRAEMALRSMSGHALLDSYNRALGTIMTKGAATQLKALDMQTDGAVIPEHTEAAQADAELVDAALKRTSEIRDAVNELRREVVQARRDRGGISGNPVRRLEEALETLTGIFDDDTFDKHPSLMGVFQTTGLRDRLLSIEPYGDIEFIIKVEKLIKAYYELKEMLADAASFIRGDVGAVPCDMNALVRETAGSIESELGLPAGVLHLELADNLPLAEINPLRIRRMMGEMVKNAWEHRVKTQQDFGIILRTGLDENDGRVALTVEDNGVGIPAELCKNGETAGRPAVYDLGDDHGLGLAEAWEFVHDHVGADLDLFTTPGRGTAFTAHFVPVTGEVSGVIGAFGPEEKRRRWGYWTPEDVRERGIKNEYELKRLASSYHIVLFALLIDMALRSDRDNADSEFSRRLMSMLGELNDRVWAYNREHDIPDHLSINYSRLRVYEEGEHPLNLIACPCLVGQELDHRIYGRDLYRKVLLPWIDEAAEDLRDFPEYARGLENILLGMKYTAEFGLLPAIEQWISNSSAPEDARPPRNDGEWLARVDRDIRTALDARDSILPEEEKKDSGRYYTVHYNNEKIPQGSPAEAALEAYVNQFLQIREEGNEKFLLKGSNRSDQGIIWVECYKDQERSQKIGEGHVDIKDISGGALRIPAMMNMALVASHIPTNTKMPADEIMAKYERLISFIRSQYEAMMGEKLSDESVKDALKFDPEKGFCITLPRAEPIPPNQIPDYYKHTTTELKRCA